MTFRAPFAVLIAALTVSACGPTPAQAPAAGASTAPGGTPASALPGTVDDEAVAAIALTRTGGATFADLDADADGADANEPEVAARFTAPGHAGADAAVTVRGGKAARAGAKSFKVQLGKGAPDYRGADEILLNKNLRDLSAVRDRLGHAVLADVPEVPTPRTWFATLTTDGADRGLFTQVERIDKGFLKRLGLDTAGYLYQADDFAFRKHGGDVATSATAGYDQGKFEDHLEIEGLDDHAKLIAMLDALDAKDADVDDVIAKHFDRANLITWMAVDVLTDRLDGSVEDYWLQAAHDAGPWKLWAGSYETGFGWHDQPGSAQPRAALPRWKEGPGAFWRSRLTRAFLKKPANVDALVARIDALAAGPFSREKIAAKLAAWKPQLAPKLATQAGWEAEYDRLQDTVAASVNRFKGAMGRPMPPTELEAEAAAAAGSYTFKWVKSYDLKGEAITYDLTIARDQALTDVVTTQKALADDEATVALPAGTYYWSVTARDAGGEWAPATDTKKLEAK